MIKLLIFCLGLVLSSGCSLETRPDTEPSIAQQGAVEVLVQESETSYGRYLAEFENNQERATEKVAAELRKRDSVSEVRILSPGRLFLLFSDGNELLLMLGQGTL